MRLSLKSILVLAGLMMACDSSPPGSNDHEGSSGPSTTDSPILPAESTGDTSEGTTSGDTTGGQGMGGTTHVSSTTGDTTMELSTSTGDASGTTEEPPPPGECVLAMMHTPCDAGSTNVLSALGICQDETMTSNWNFQAPPQVNGESTWQVATAYGTCTDPNTQKSCWGPHEGNKVLMISTGLLPKPIGGQTVLIADGDVYNDAAVGGVWDSDELPPPMSPTKGSPDPLGFANCDGQNDCSNTIEAQWALGNGDAEDKTWFSFDLTAPANAKGYMFDFAFFSAEFPEWVDTDFNDIFVVWQASEMYTGNVTFINGQPLTVTALWPIEFQGECEFGDPNCVGKDPHLAGTGFESGGGATGWYTGSGGVNPGETFTLAFAIFDMGDSIYDTTVLLDNFRWDCEGCVPNGAGDPNSCGVKPQ